MALAAIPEVPGFKALSPLGVGPSSNIFSAHGEQMGRWIALTIYSTAVSDDRDANRFRRAYELTRRLGVHPHSVTLLDHGVTPDRRPYVVTEFYEHGTFDSRVTGHQPLPVDKTLRIGVALAGALETAHRADVVHGGVHPARILADSDDEPSLADTGLVPLVDPSGTEALLGPINYHAPPEVLEGDTLSAAADVYSLASTLYTLLTARPPYSSSDPEDTSAALLFRVLRHEVPPIARSDIPPSLEQALRGALHSNPRQRPATVLAFAQSLQGIQQEIGAPVTHPVLLDVAPSLKVVPETNTTALQPPSPAPPTHQPPVARSPAGQPGRDQAPQVFVPYPFSESEPWHDPLADIPPSSASGLDAVGLDHAAADPQPNAPSPFGGLQAFAPPPPSEPPDGHFTPGGSSPLPAEPVPDDLDLPDQQPLHERLAAAASVWSPERPVARDGAHPDGPPETVGTEAPDLPGRRAHRSSDRDASDPGSGRHTASVPLERPARGPRALPLIVLGAVVVVLLVGAVWMVISGSDPSDASPPGDPEDEQLVR